jgi:hypothetical protein
MTSLKGAVNECYRPSKIFTPVLKRQGFYFMKLVFLRGENHEAVG